MFHPNQADFFASYGEFAQLPPQDRPEIVFSGRSNVGKSSLINRLCSRKSLARVSSTPGKTATINFYTVDDVYFVDLPGYGYARIARQERVRWDSLINGYFDAVEGRVLLLQLLDSRHAPSQEDEQMMAYLQHRRLSFYVVLTKADKLKPKEAEAALQQFSVLCAPYGCGGVFLTSAQTGMGIEALTERIARYEEESGWSR